MSNNLKAKTKNELKKPIPIPTLPSEPIETQYPRYLESIKPLCERVNTLKLLAKRSFEKFMLSSGIKKNGILYKKHGKICEYWTPKLCKLYRNKLVFYSTENLDTIKEVIDFNLLKCTIEVSKVKDYNAFRILVLGSKKIFTFRLESYTQLKEWVYAIYKQIISSKCYRKNMTYVALQRHFWRYMRISPMAIQRTANTGDLVLFRSKGCMPLFLRCFTCSDSGIFSNIYPI